MADAVRTTVLGYRELISGSKRLFERIEESAQDAFENVAEKTAGAVRGNLPAETGRLAGSVEAGVDGGSVIVGMGDGVPYARYVEYGGRGHPHSAQGNYLYPVAIQAEPLLVAAGEDAAEKEIDRMRWPNVG